MLKLLFVTLLVGASANVVRREVNCEKLLLPFLDDPNPLCAQIYETREAVKNGIASVENTVVNSSKIQAQHKHERKLGVCRFYIAG